MPAGLSAVDDIARRHDLATRVAYGACPTLDNHETVVESRFVRDGSRLVSPGTMRVLIVLLLLAGVARAAPVTFETMTFESPKGWKVTTSSTGVQMQTADDRSGTFAMIVISPSAPSLQSLDKDFDTAWANVAPMFKVTDAPAMVPGDTENGWASKAGSAAGEVGGVRAVVILVTMTGHGRAMNAVIATSSSEKYQAALQAFLASVKMGVPKGALPAPTPTTAPGTASTTNGAGSTVTTFNDGWTSTVEQHWVRATRPGHTVYLHYGVALDDESRRDITGFMWRTLVAPRYANLKNVNIAPYSELKFPYYEATAEATDRAGAAVFVLMRVTVGGGVARTIEIVSSSRAALDKQFPDRPSMLAIAGANRFSVGKELAGTWSRFTGASVDLYYVSSGGYAGMNAAALSDTFRFAGSGSYESEHKGAVGRVGNQNMFQERHKGVWSLTSPWEVTVNRSDKVVTVYDAWYEAVRGGRLLHLTDKKYTGMNYTLARVK